jgi:chromosome segregation ATPase
MFCKMIKWGVLSAAGLTIAGGVLFGRDLSSYLTSGTRSVRGVVQDNVPIDFQLRRARDLVDDIIPEMQANVRIIAQQEIEIESLKKDINDSTRALNEEKVRVAKVRDCLNTERTSFSFNDHSYTREQIKEDLARRFDTVKEAEVVLSGKRRLLDNREKSLTAAEQMLEKARSQKMVLEGQIAALEGQYSLVKAASAGSHNGLNIDNSKLAQSQKLIDQIKKQLDVAERVLSHESRFIEPIQIDGVSEKDLVTQVDDYLKPQSATDKPTDKPADLDSHEAETASAKK